MEHLLTTFISYCFPKRCPICNHIIVNDHQYICNRCMRNIQPIQEPRCKKCSKPLLQAEAEYCYDCMTHKHTYEKGSAVFVYEGAVKESIMRYKFYGKREYSKFYVQMIQRELEEKITSWNIDLILPVPLHKKKLRIRGFNQATLLAQGIGEFMNIPVYEDVLFRSRYTTPQKKLDDRQRIKNLRAAFACTGSEKKLKGKRVLLVDDIYTTGSTIEACSQVLEQAGCQSVYFVTICIGKGY